MADHAGRSTARPVPARIRVAARRAAHESRASLIPALPVKQLADPELATTACRRPDRMRSCVTIDRRRLDPIGGEHARRGDRRIGDDQAQVLAPRLLRKPALTPAKRKPRTGAGSSRTFMATSGADLIRLGESNASASARCGS